MLQLWQGGGGGGGDHRQMWRRHHRKSHSVCGSYRRWREVVCCRHVGGQQPCARLRRVHRRVRENSCGPCSQTDLVLPLPTLLGIEVVLFALVEYKRYEGFKKTGKVPM